MKKIMFDDRFGLTDLVLSGEKTQTRRVISCFVCQTVLGPLKGLGSDVTNCYLAMHHARYKVGEVVAVAQPYKAADVLTYNAYNEDGTPRKNGASRHREMLRSQGYRNKMFVKADLMPHQIRITGVRIERLQDISDDDVRKEGIVHVEWRQYPSPFSDHYVDHDLWTLPMWRSQFDGSFDDDDHKAWGAKSPKAAFYVLIRKMMGLRKWNENPWVFVYDFELVK